MEISELVGKTLKAVTVSDDKDQISFETSDGKKFLMHHDQDCCESVTVDDICGDLADLVGFPVLTAEERSRSTSDDDDDCQDLISQDPDNYYGDSQTWTFYELATNKGSVTVRWYGTSNGYYSEGVSFEEIDG